MLSTDLVYAFRTLWRSPVFTITAAVTIALASGASTAIFSVTNAVLLRPLPYKDPARLVLACSDMRRRNVQDFPLSDADFLDLRQGARNAFEDFAAVETFRGVLPGIDGAPEQVRIAAVSTNFFRLLGAAVVAGRDFQESDGAPQPPPPPGGSGAQPPAPRLPVMAMLSDAYFQRRFGGDRSVVGKPLPVSAGPAPIIAGVLARGFELLFPPPANMEQFPDVWFAARILYDPANRNNVQWRVIGRLKHGATIERAQAEADTIAEKIRRENTISRTAGQYIRLEPMQQHLVKEVRPAILTLMGGAVFLLLIACANVANLMLVRASLRQRELAMRTALGGTWWRLLRQTLAEALLIAALGTAAGIALAELGIRELLAIAPANLPRSNAIHLDPAVLAFSICAGLAAAVLFGVLPVFHTVRPDLMSVLRSGGRAGALGPTGRLRSSVVVLEVALAFVLLIGSGLMLRSFLAIQRVDLGFDPHQLLTFQILGRFGHTPQERAAFKRQLRARLGAIAGVRGRVAASLAMPFAGGFSPVRWGRAEALADPSRFQAADLQVVLPGYFETLVTPLIAGRMFTEADNSSGRELLIIDQALALKAFPRESAVGKRILFRVRTAEAQWGEIVGVVAHQRFVSPAEPGREQLYVTDGYMDHRAVSWWALRAEGDPARYAAAVREHIRRAGGQLSIGHMQTMDALVIDARAGARFSLLLIGLFSVIAALLAAVGLYGVLATSVHQRTAEIGVRMALGAAPSRIFRLVVGQGLRLSGIGIAVGLAAALGLTRALTTMLVEVKPTDPATFIAIAAIFLCIAAAASWVPARRAAALDPTEALREK